MRVEGSETTEDAELELELTVYSAVFIEMLGVDESGECMLVMTEDTDEQYQIDYDDQDFYYAFVGPYLDEDTEDYACGILFIAGFGAMITEAPAITFLDSDSNVGIDLIINVSTMNFESVEALMEDEIWAEIDIDSEGLWFLEDEDVASLEV